MCCFWLSGPLNDILQMSQFRRTSFCCVVARGFGFWMSLDISDAFFLCFSEALCCFWLSGPVNVKLQIRHSNFESFPGRELWFAAFWEGSVACCIFFLCFSELLCWFWLSGPENITLQTSHFSFDSFWGIEVWEMARPVIIWAQPANRLRGDQELEVVVEKGGTLAVGFESSDFLIKKKWCWYCIYTFQNTYLVLKNTATVSSLWYLFIRPSSHLQLWSRIVFSSLSNIFNWKNQIRFT